MMEGWLYPVFAIFCAGTGVAVAWGMLKASLEALTQRVDALQAHAEQNHELLVALREEVRVRFASMRVRTSKKRKD